ncbi:AAA family ATPase [Rhizobium sp. KVB221]|uniref:AAA family ATPase n=1 Tax=Rhizobium setariae TaxID=2801340 RepID=A0A936YNE5_9HYPH|nr:AAA family ATPase [Rhizobium setariae]MBL0373769.1 AAA family ATPase [Rhizobium setariae]
MRLRRLDLTRYGKFTDFTIDFGEATAGSPDLHIVYGLNEAGKSTTFSAFLDLLFGIPERSQYNFLHQYSTMQIGARLQFNSGDHELVRLKQRTGSLLDERGQPVNEALLASALGGINRDAYRTMFSLDDQSLKEGGNAIIQSKGDLGELLFSASAGLAGLSRSLAAAGDDAGAIYKKRSSSTRVAELKRTLAALKSRRDEIDTFANAYAALVGAHGQAQGSYDKAMGELAEARSKHGEISRLLNALPLTAEAARLETQLADFADLPRPPSDWFALLPQLSRDETRLLTLVDTADRTIDTLKDEIEAIQLDDGLLALAGRIEALEDGRARYRTAESDLPKRKAALAEQQALLSSILTTLERAGDPEPSQLLVPASLTGAIRELIEARSGIEAQLASAEREVLRANDSLERHLDEEKHLCASTKAPAPELLARIGRALAQWNLPLVQSRLAVEERTRQQLMRACEAHFAALKPWTGDAAALRGSKTAEPRQIETWRIATAAIDKRVADHQNRLRDLATERRASETKIGLLEEAGPIDDTEALQIRQARDTAWQDHRKRLDDESAGAFEVQMRRDDVLAERRLSCSRDLAELRQYRQAATMAADSMDRHQELLDEARAELTCLTDTMRGHLPTPDFTGADKTAGEILTNLESWASRRNQALDASHALQQSEDETTQIRQDIATHRIVLETAMTDAGSSDATQLQDIELAEAAAALLAEAEKVNNAQGAFAKTLANLERDLMERQRDNAQARDAMDKWQGAWNASLGQTWFSDKAGSVASIREILNVLADLPGAIRERDQLAQRVTTMERDQAAFQADVEAIVAELGRLALPTDPRSAADALLADLEASLRARQMRTDKGAELGRQIEKRRTLESERALHEARKAELTDFFGTDTLTAVNTCLEQVRSRQQLEDRLSTLKDQIVSGLRVETYQRAQDHLAAMDAAAAERDAIELEQRIDDLTERTKLLYAEVTRTADKLEAVGGDNSVAAIEAERRTIFLEIEDLAIRYLRLRTGTLAAEQALFAYREKHRSSMMVRASEAFRQITRGEYTGLAARPDKDKDKEILIGMARDGGSKLAEAMSTGTQFQLYLALRLAGYEEFAAVRPAVPFIADDIMESFDDPRSEEVFRLLGEMAKVGQVIYLTHHRHLCDIASEVVPGVKIHDING